jgi:nucleoside-diphosphate-sugar epimerase
MDHANNPRAARIHLQSDVDLMQPDARRSSTLEQSAKIILFGGAGLVGQNLVILLKAEGFRRIVVIDKHAANLAILQRLHPDVETVLADMADPGAWEERIEQAVAAVMLQAQIGGDDADAYRRNNIVATQRALAACHRHGLPYLVHASSSVINSMARDLYTDSKAEQERLVVASGLAHCVLRPTLMFGWFDRKHLGWLARFMQRVPVFPIPGSGRYMRQPLYVMDFCRIVLACLQRREQGTVYDITGRERVDYIDIIRAIKATTGAKAAIVRIPYGVFRWLLKAYALIDRDPPFTASQLQALVTPDQFELMPWWNIFSVPATPFADAIRATYGPGPYRDVVLEF